jgi:hypothetical protein
MNVMKGWAKNRRRNKEKHVVEDNECNCGGRKRGKIRTI